MFGLYAKLVAELAKSPRGNVPGVFASVVQTLSLPADAAVVCLHDPAVPGPWWEHFQLLFDTGPQRPFKPRSPSAESFAACTETIAAGLALFKRANPDFHAEVHRLVRMT